MFNCAAGREEHCKQISLVCVGSAHSVWATLGLPLLMACLLSWSTLLRLQVALQGNCLKQALGCMYFPGLSHSSSGSHIFHKGTDACIFLPFSGSSSLGDQVLDKCTLPRWGGASYHCPRPSLSISWVLSGSTVSGVLCVSSGELISGCDPPGGYQSSRTPGRLG